MQQIWIATIIINEAVYTASIRLACRVTNNTATAFLMANAIRDALMQEEGGYLKQTSKYLLYIHNVLVSKSFSRPVLITLTPCLHWTRATRCYATIDNRTHYNQLCCLHWMRRDAKRHNFITTIFSFVKSKLSWFR